MLYLEQIKLSMRFIQMEKQLRRKKRIGWFFVVVWMGVIFYLSHQPATASGELSAGITGMVLKLFSIFPIQLPEETLHFFIRKLAHFSAYFILGVLLFYSLHIGQKRQMTHAFIALLLSIMYAVTDEVHQLFIPGRSGEVRDVLIDSMGALTGILMYSSIIHFFVKK